MTTYEAPAADGRETFSAICPRFVAHKESKNRSKTTMSVGLDQHRLGVHPTPDRRRQHLQRG
jgi:hypothetical protein